MFTGVFITGTDTDVGKTLVAAKCYRESLIEGLETVAVKVVQTGCKRWPSGELIAPDAEIYRAAGTGLSGGRIVVCRKYEPACSPHLAARLAGDRLTVERLTADIAAAAGDGRRLVVEGAGGLLVPLNERETMLDLMVALHLPAIVVVDNKLGAINHALLTLQALARAAVPIAGLVFNQCSPANPENEFIRADNVETIVAIAGVPLLFRLPYIANCAAGDPRFWPLPEVFDD